MGSGLSAPEFVKITHLRVVGALTWTNIYLSLWNFGKRKVTYKHRSSSNLGEFCSREVELSAPEFVKISHFKACWRDNLNEI